MAYHSPDYEVVQLNVTTLFASYNSGCVEYTYTEWSYTVPCKDTVDYREIEKTGYNGNMA